MATDKRQFTLRMQDEIFLKIKAISTKDHRSIAMEIEYILEKYIAEYESQHGEINSAERE